MGEDVRGLQIQLSAALKERDEARAAMERDKALALDRWDEQRQMTIAAQEEAWKHKHAVTAAESERDALRAQVQAWKDGVCQDCVDLRAALNAATDGLFAARNMLQAINEGDPTPDRKRAADRAWDAEKKARAALAGGGDRG